MAINLPVVAYLPTMPGMDASEVRAALGNCNRQRVHWLRKHHGFPPSAYYHGAAVTITATANVAAWLDQRGVKIEWI